MWTAAALSYCGDGIVLSAAPLTAAMLTSDPRLIAGLTLAATLPWPLFCLVSGAIVDRVDRIRLMWRIDLLRAVIMAALTVSFVAGRPSMQILLACFFCLGTAETFFANAAQAALPSIVPSEKLPSANGRLQAAELVLSQLAGPPLGSILFVLGAALPFGLDSSSFLLSAGLLLLIRRPRVMPMPTPPVPQTSLRRQIAEGMRWLWGNSQLRLLAILTGLINLLTEATMSVLIIFSKNVLRIGDVGYGYLLAIAALGGVAASIIGPRLSARIGDRRTLLAVLMIQCCTQLAIFYTSSFVPVAAALALAAFGIVMWNIVTISLRQTIVPDHLLGRVNSVYRFVSWGMLPVGAFLGGITAAALGTRAVFLISGVILGAVGIIAVFLLRRTHAQAKKLTSSRTSSAGTRHNSCRPTEDEHIQAVELIESGRKVDDVTETVDVGRRPVLRGWEKSRRGGLSELSTELASGRPSTLSDRQMLELRALIIGNNPRQLHFGPALWTREMIAELILQRFGVILSRINVGRILKELGIYPQGSLDRVYQENTEKVRVWREKTYPEIREEATRRGAVVFFADESAVRTDFRPSTTWGLHGQTSVVTVTREGKSIMMVSAISSREELRFHIHEGTFRPSDFIDFCKQLMHDIESDIFLIVDRISVHMSGETIEFVRSTEGKLRLFFPPSYSPELYPDDWIGKNVKHDEIGRPAIRGVDDLRAVALGTPNASPENVTESACVLC
jgi:MFS family permease/transposase